MIISHGMALRCWRPPREQHLQSFLQDEGGKGFRCPTTLKRSQKSQMLPFSYFASSGIQATGSHVGQTLGFAPSAWVLLAKPLMPVPKSGVLLTKSINLLLLHPEWPQLNEASRNFPCKCLREARSPGHLQGSRLQDPRPLPAAAGRFSLLEPFGLSPDAAGGDTAGSKCCAPCEVPSSKSSQERLSRWPGLLHCPCPLLRSQTAASYRKAAACLVQAVQGALQVSCCPGKATGAGHVQQFSYCKHKKNPPKVSLEARKGKGCCRRQQESAGAEDSSLESMRKRAKTGPAGARAHAVLALPSKQLLQ